MDKVQLAVTYMRQQLEIAHTFNGSPEKEIQEHYDLIKDRVLISPSETELSIALFMAFVGESSPGSASTAGRNVFMLLLVHQELLPAQQSADICFLSDVQGCRAEWPWEGQHFNQ